MGTVADLPQPPNKEQSYNTWSEIMQPTIDRCELAASLNQSVMFPPEGAHALGTLVALMARLLDEQAKQQESL